MSIIVLLMILVLFAGLGGSGYVWRLGKGNAAVGPIGLALLILLLVWVFGGLG